MKTCLPRVPIPIIYSVLPVLLLLIFNTVQSQAPANDLCSNAAPLTPATSCSTTGGTLKSATVSAPAVISTCGSNSSADVWYKFVATNPYPTITISTFGANFKSAIPVMELYSGSCGSLASLTCITGTTSSTTLAISVPNSIGGAGLTVGATYYIRVFTNTTTNTSTGTWTFNICITNLTGANPTIDYGKSYVNLNKGNNGGTIEPGDTLEIRATFVVRANTAYNCSFTDKIPTNTTYVDSTLRVLTNEGKIFQQFTDNLDSDGGTISGSSVTINMGTAASGTGGGYVLNTSKPSFYLNTCIMVASYRVVVNAVPYNTKVSVGKGVVSYSNSSGTVNNLTFPADTIMVYKNYGICSNTVGTNAILSESGGTFGSGSIKDRGASTKVPSNYTYAPFSTSGNMPNDYYYGISNNTSGGTTATNGYSILNNWQYPDNSQAISHRIFSVWDIIGDHTGATNPLLGNPATDDNTSKTGGYMVVINASYKTDTAFLDTVKNLCPNTYYEYSAWFRNICKKCGCDVNGKGASQGAGYIATALNDSSGVHPNLTFNINGFDYYTTGDVLYTGQWIKKGFTYLTGPSQTSMIINIRNNAPGGGGNDWAIDDIGVASCSPNISLTPNKPDTLCMGSSDDTVRFKVSSYFNNYTEWKIEQSVDNGSTWTLPGNDTTGAAPIGSSVPVMNTTSNQYEYLVSRYYRVSSINLKTIYRLTLASTTLNLANANCSFISSSPKIVYGVNCMIILPTDVIGFSGQLNKGYSNLKWTSTSETGNIKYTIERSDDQVNYKAVGTVEGNAAEGSGATYQFTDPKEVVSQAYYRLMISDNQYVKYSRVILLSNSTVDFDLKMLSNPFKEKISFNIATTTGQDITISLFDAFGRVIKQEKQKLNSGINSVQLSNLGLLQQGTYTLQVNCMEKIVNKKLLKLD